MNPANLVKFVKAILGLLALIIVIISKPTNQGGKKQIINVNCLSFCNIMLIIMINMICLC